MPFILIVAVLYDFKHCIFEFRTLKKLFPYLSIGVDLIWGDLPGTRFWGAGVAIHPSLSKKAPRLKGPLTRSNPGLSVIKPPMLDDINKDVLSQLFCNFNKSSFLRQ